MRKIPKKKDKSQKSMSVKASSFDFLVVIGKEIKDVIAPKLKSKIFE